MRHFTVALLLSIIFHPAFAQTDTVTVMQYNLLNYGNAANPTGYKKPRLTTILQYVQPDLFGANEILNDPDMPQKITDSVLSFTWTHGYYSNTNNETQINMLFWKTAKFGYLGQDVVCNDLRDIVAYHLYYKDTFSAVHDTIKLTVIVAHFKAGATTQNAIDRAAEAQDVAYYLSSAGKAGNYLFMGDLNLYTSTETAYQYLLNNTNVYARLYDPINRPGAWSGDAGFADIHTQSTRSTQLSDGGATGGLDDRFDHIMASGNVMTNAAGVQILPSTYKAIGQDGQHLNKAVNASPTNTAVPANVAQALYEMSDHLPVTAKLAMRPTPHTTEVPAYTIINASIVNPVNDKLIVYTSTNEKLEVAMYNMMGAVIASGSLNGSGELDLPAGLPSGLYFVKLTATDGRSLVQKVVKQ